MAIKTTPRPSFPTWEPFDVVRREVIARIEPGLGSEGPVEAAFREAGAYIQENAGSGSPVSVEFEIWGTTFRASAEPTVDRHEDREDY